MDYVFSRNAVVHFGKYKGKKVKQILDIDPSYLVWAKNTIPWFNLREDILNDAIERTFSERVGYYINEGREMYWQDEYY